MKVSSRVKRTLFYFAMLLVVSGIGFALADRYLIEHVTIAHVSAAAGGQSAAAEGQSAAAASTMPQSGHSGLALADPVSNSVQLSDGWSYQGGGVSITIQQFTSSSGSDTVTYFAADVILSDATQLSSAFAKDSFGQNIVQYTSQIAADNQAVFAINGDYYGFRADGIVIRNGVIYRDIPARTGLAFYRDGSMRIYDETQTSAQALLDAGVWNTLSFGPALVEDGVAADDFTRVSVDNNLGNHTIQGNNPRTGVGMIDNNHFVFVVVDGRSPGYSRGVSLAEFAQIFANLGCKQAYNIDGGGSSTMVFRGQVINNPLGRSKERATSDILYVGQ